MSGKWIKYIKYAPKTELESITPSLNKFKDGASGRVKLKFNNHYGFGYVCIKIKNVNDNTWFILKYGDTFSNPSLVHEAIRRMNPAVLAAQIIGVQPLPSSAGNIFKFGVNYKNARSSTKQKTDLGR